MISFLQGKVHSVSKSQVTLDVRGVGYEVSCTQSCLAELSVGTEASLVIFTDMREGSIALYGFRDVTEKEVFLLLNKVKGVGAKSASDILSSIDKHDLLRCIGSSDVKRLQSLKGIGKKTAERIIVELRDQVSAFVQGQLLGQVEVENVKAAPVNEAEEALVALGFSRKSALEALSRIESSKLSTTEPGELVKEALGYI